MPSYVRQQIHLSCESAQGFTDCEEPLQAAKQQPQLAGTQKLPQAWTDPFGLASHRGLSKILNSRNAIEFSE